MNRGYPVFVVDDDDADALALSRDLADEGYQAETCASAADFFARAGDAGRGCVIVEDRVAGESGLVIQARIGDAGLAVPVIFLVRNGDLCTCVRAMRAGAVDYLTKPARMHELRDALRRAEALSDSLHHERTRAASVHQRLSRLTPREREVLDLVLAGRRNKQIAAALSSQESTVKVHRSRLMRKLETRSLAELLGIARYLEAHAAVPPLRLDRRRVERSFAAPFS